MLRVRLLIALLLVLLVSTCWAQDVYIDDFSDAAWTMENWYFRTTYTDQVVCEEWPLDAEVVDGILVLACDTEPNTHSYAVSPFPASDYFTISARVKMASRYNDNVHLSWHIDDLGNHCGFECLKGGAYPAGNCIQLYEYYEWRCGGGQLLAPQKPYTFESDRWYVLKVCVKPGSQAGRDSVYCMIDGWIVFAEEVEPLSLYGKAGINFAWANTVYCDWFSMRLSGPSSTESTAWGRIKSMYN